METDTVLRYRGREVRSGEVAYLRDLIAGAADTISGGCGPTDRYRVTGASAWDDTTYDRNTGLIWRRDTERNSSLVACDSRAHDSAYCCTSGLGGYAECNWLGSQQYCTDLGMRLPSKDELLSIAGNNFSKCAFNEPWLSWSTSPAGPDLVWFVDVYGNTHPLAVSRGQSYYSVRCVR